MLGSEEFFLKFRYSTVKCDINEHLHADLHLPVKCSACSFTNAPDYQLQHGKTRKAFLCSPVLASCAPSCNYLKDHGA